MPSPSHRHRRPRILQCISHLAVGGAERVTLTLMGALRNDFEFALHAVEDASRDSIGDALADELAALHVPLFVGTRIPAKRGGLVSGAYQLAKSIRHFAPDLIHLHTEIPEAACATLLSVRPALRQIPLVRTVHSAAFWKFWRPLGCWCDRGLAHAQMAAVSHSAARSFLALRNDSGAPRLREQPATIYNGVPLPASSNFPGPNADGAVRIVFGGRLETEKGADLLPAILAQTPAPAPGAHLHIFGRGRHEPLLRQLSLNPPRGWTVSLDAPVAGFAEKLSQFDLALMPSRNEGLGLVAIEAALAGTPLIATDAPGLREALPPNHPWIAHAGRADHFAQILRAALSQKSKWPEIAASAQAFARGRFTVDQMADGYRALYRSALPAINQPVASLL